MLAKKNRDNLTKTIHYRGGTITMKHTNANWRNLCKIHNHIQCWFSTSGYLKQRVLIFGFDSCNPVQTLKYIRDRIKNDPIRAI